MTLAMAVSYGPHTIDDYDALPNDGQRYELIHGRIEVSPRPAEEHQDVMGALHIALYLALPPGYGVATETEVGFSDRRECFVPDLLVKAPRPVKRVQRVTEDRLLLAVEIVSPSSGRNDRTVKPPVYAKAGVPAYWVVETDPFSVTEFGLSGDEYELVQVVTGDEIVVTRPFDMKIDLARARAATLLPDA